MNNPVEFPIDVVVTWVNGNDLEYQKNYLIITKYSLILRNYFIRDFLRQKSKIFVNYIKVDPLILFLVLSKKS